MSQYTKGPWLHRGKSDSVHEADAEYPYGRQIFKFDDDSAPCDADLSIILAAPDLLEAAERYLKFRHTGDIGQGYQFSGVHPQTQLKSAIAKAKGEMQ